MKLLVDQGLPRSTVTFLARAGIAATHVGAIGLGTADDRAILGAAKQADSVVVTLDADFHALLALSHAEKPSVIRIRTEGLRAEPLADLLLHVIRRCEKDLDAARWFPQTPIASAFDDSLYCGSRRVPLAAPCPCPPSVCPASPH